MILQAPEFLKSAGSAGPKCDVYSFGVTMWSAVAKTLPFENVHPHTVIFKVGSLHEPLALSLF